VSTNPRPITLLVAEDDDDDFLLARRALEGSRLANPIHRVRDGEELLDYLHHRSTYAAPGSSPAPALILLDLNMPRLDGREALRAIKSDARLRTIPVVVLTTSRAEEDVLRSYELGVNSFIRKPVTFDGLVEALAVIKRYWFEIVELPGRESPS